MCDCYGFVVLFGKRLARAGSGATTTAVVRARCYQIAGDGCQEFKIERGRATGSMVARQHPAAMIGNADVTDELGGGGFPGIVESDATGRIAGAGEGS